MRSPLARARAWMVVLAVAAPLTAACTAEGGGAGAGEASCAAVIEYQGHRYFGSGELRREPATTGRQVTGSLPGCDDSGGQDPVEPDRAVEVHVLAEVPLETAFQWNGSVFIREDRELPAAKRIWFRAPSCRTAGTFRVVADWLGVTGPKEPRFDGDLRPPYRLEVRVTDGPSRYLGTTITVRADAATRPALGREDVEASLWEGGEVAAELTCDGHRFFALSLRVPQR